MKKKTTLLAGTSVALCAGAAGAQDIDGIAEDIYQQVVVQDTQTQFGDSDLGMPGQANGSELDNGSFYVGDGGLFLHLGGNLESNFNKLDIFFDTGDGGQNRLRGDNTDVDFDGLNRMGDDGSGNGLTFDDGFTANYFLTVTGGNDPFEFFMSGTPILTDGGSSPDGGFLGGGPGRTIDGSNGILAGIDNSNTAGVGPGAGPADQDAAAAVTTGVEFFIPFDVLGVSGQDVKITALINGGSHDFVSNQVLGGIGGGENLGEPRSVDFSTIDGNQFFTASNVPAPGSAALLALGGLAGVRRRR